MKNIITKTAAIMFALLSNGVASVADADLGACLTYIRHSDIAGVGAIESLSNSLMKIAVSAYWVGDPGSNTLSVSGSGEWEPSPAPPENDDGIPLNTGEIGVDLTGKTVVFFAITNEWKINAETPADPYGFDWTFAVDGSVASNGPACPPRFHPLAKTWFAVESSGSPHVAFFSNVTHCLFYSKDATQLYAALRDELKPDFSVETPYRAIAGVPLRTYQSTANETVLTQMLNDSLLAPRFRTNALSQLKRRYNWPATNTVPVP